LDSLFIEYAGHLFSKVSARDVQADKQREWIEGDAEQARHKLAEVDTPDIFKFGSVESGS
jgi:hypothetical protein